MYLQSMVSSIWAGTLVSAFVIRATVKCKPLQMSKFGGMMSVSAIGGFFCNDQPLQMDLSRRKTLIFKSCLLFHSNNYQPQQLCHLLVILSPVFEKVLSIIRYYMNHVNYFLFKTVSTQKSVTSSYHSMFSIP